MARNRMSKVLVLGTSCHCHHRESSLPNEALSAQNGSATQDLALTFSHERGFMPVFLQILLMFQPRLSRGTPVVSRLASVGS